MTSTKESPDAWAQLVNSIGALAENDDTGQLSRRWHAMVLIAIEQAINAEEETVYTPLAKEAITHFAQAVGINPLPVSAAGKQQGQLDL